MRGRYLSLQLTVDGCQSTLPSAKHASFPRDINGVRQPGPYVIRAAADTSSFQARLKVEDNKLLAIRIEDAEESTSATTRVSMARRARAIRCASREPVDFYIPEHAIDPTRSSPARNSGSK